jgi:hypothetical protein
MKVPKGHKTVITTKYENITRKLEYFIFADGILFTQNGGPDKCTFI